MKKPVFYMLFLASLLLFRINGIYPQAINAPVGGSIPQIVSFYNQYANALKTAERLIITKTHIREVEMEVPFLLRPFMTADRMRGLNNQNITITETFVNGRSTNNPVLELANFLPINGRPLVSMLLPVHVIGASCVREGNNWLVTIRLREEPFDSIFDTSGTGSGNSDTMSEDEQERMVNEMLARTGYGSSMDLGFNDMQGEESSGEGSRQGSGNMNVSMEGGFQNGIITAIINDEGRIISLTHSYNMNVSFTVLRMRGSMNTSSRREYLFTF